MSKVSEMRIVNELICLKYKHRYVGRLYEIISDVTQQWFQSRDTLLLL